MASDPGSVMMKVIRAVSDVPFEEAVGTLGTAMVFLLMDQCDNPPEAFRTMAAGMEVLLADLVKAQHIEGARRIN